MTLRRNHSADPHARNGDSLACPPSRWHIHVFQSAFLLPLLMLFMSITLPGCHVLPQMNEPVTGSATPPADFAVVLIVASTDPKESGTGAKHVLLSDRTLRSATGVRLSKGYFPGVTRVISPDEYQATWQIARKLLVELTSDGTRSAPPANRVTPLPPPLRIQITAGGRTYRLDRTPATGTFRNPETSGTASEFPQTEASRLAIQAGIRLRDQLIKLRRPGR